MHVDVCDYGDKRSGIHVEDCLQLKCFSASTLLGSIKVFKKSK